MIAESRLQSEPPNPEDEVSLLVLGSVLLRWRRTIVAMGLLGGIIGLTLGLTSPRMYKSEATFIPETEGSISGFSSAASQFGIMIPRSGGGWRAPMYVELARSRAVLEPIAFDTLTVAEKGGQRVSVMNLLGIDEPSPAARTNKAVRALMNIVEAKEQKALGAVKVTVTTEWPSVSLAIAELLVQGVNDFNVTTRKSQVAAERQFVEARSFEAERSLRETEDRLQAFLQRNRAIDGSPELAFQRDRLQREVEMRQQVHKSLMQSREEARIREVRDTPVITLLDAPRMPVEGEARGSVQKGLMGGVLGGILAVLIAYLAHTIAGARRTPTEEAKEFFQLVEEATPRFLRRARRPRA